MSPFHSSIIFSVFVLSASTLSAETAPYLGVKAGYQFSQDDAYHYKKDPEGSIASLFAGYQIAPQWAVEAGYQYHTELHASATSVDIKTSLIEVAARYDWYWQENASLYGRLGLAYWKMTKLSPDFKRDATGFSPLGEIGLAYQFTPRFRGSLGYQYIDEIGDAKTRYYDSNSIIWGLSYSFPSDDTTSIESVKIRPISAAVIEQPNVQFRHPISETCRFEFASSTLNKSCQVTLVEAAEALSVAPHIQVSIVGHTDSTGSLKVNQVLSERRAKAAAHFLEQHGVSSSQLDISGKGELEPLVLNATKEGRASNRRVEIHQKPEVSEAANNE
ncbi:OmpA family protein [Vibrio sagamiensis]|uniref:Outer membrane protein A n=1 Tax=Vibrio sagamiensis NBRC 104589 TaxID=1219064 RepID=A0A511QAY6_9VIBR|nr:OmpA family protein [Vibrio sagamiensis]PNQ64793.1 hypothetical protein C1141_09665 [Vibrio agarivorans]GEM74460.1 outer membrane protein A [Vibrio sagamiensis NBRC 104589]